MRALPLLLLALLLAPLAQAGGPYGSLACQEPWSVGGASQQVSTASSGTPGARASLSWFCFNYSNYGENPYHSAMAYGEVSVAGHRAWASAGAYEGTSYYGGGPTYEAGCYALVVVDAAVQWVPCGPVPAPWLPLVLGVMRDVAAVDFECQAAWNPSMQACASGDARGTAVAVSGCDPGRATRVNALGNRVRSAEAGFVACTATGLLLA